MSVEVRFLGTANTFADGGRFQTCIAVTGSTGRMLLDCGGSSLPAITRSCDPGSIDAVAVTHLHGDHFGGLPYLAMHQKWAPRSRPLHIGGPPSLERKFHDAARVLCDDLYQGPLPYALSFIVLCPEPVRLGPAMVSAHPVTHVPRSEPHGLRVRIDDKLIAFSGDAIWTDQLAVLAQGADLFICEATLYDGSNPVHLSARELAAHVPELGCKRVIATHLGKTSLAHLDEFPVEHAEDGMVVEV